MIWVIKFSELSGANIGGRESTNGSLKLYT